MIIEEVSKDEITVLDETRKFLRKRMRLILNFHDGKALIRFNEEEKMYEVLLPQNTPREPEELIKNYNLNHEPHHIWKEICLPYWLGVRKDFPFKANFIISLEFLQDCLINNFTHALAKLREKERKILLDNILTAAAYFFSYVNSLINSRNLPQPLAFLNAFEDYDIEFHLMTKHENLRNSESYTMEALRNSIEFAKRFRAILKDIIGFPIVLPVPLSNTKELLEDIYSYFDLKAMWMHKVHPEDYYKLYLSYGKKVLRKTHKKDFAMRYRIKLELERAKNNLKMTKKCKKEILSSSESCSLM